MTAVLGCLFSQMLLRMMASRLTLARATGVARFVPGALMRVQAQTVLPSPFDAKECTAGRALVLVAVFGGGVLSSCTGANSTDEDIDYFDVLKAGLIDVLTAEPAFAEASAEPSSQNEDSDYTAVLSSALAGGEGVFTPIDLDEVGSLPEAPATVNTGKRKAAVSAELVKAAKDGKYLVLSDAETESDTKLVRLLRALVRRKKEVKDADPKVAVSAGGAAPSHAALSSAAQSCSAAYSKYVQEEAAEVQRQAEELFGDSAMNIANTQAEIVARATDFAADSAAVAGVSGPTPMAAVRAALETNDELLAQAVATFGNAVDDEVRS